MFCEKCGAQIADTEVLCPECGAKQSTVAEATPASGILVSSSVKLYDILVFIAIGLMAIGTFLPVASVSMYGITQSVSYVSGGEGVDGNGIFVILAAVAAFALYYLDKEKFMAIPAAVTAILLLAFLGTMSEASSAAQLASGFGFGTVEVGFGFGYFVMWIGAIATAVLPFTPLAQGRGLYFKNIFKA